MRKLALLTVAVVLIATPALAEGPILYDNGPLATRPHSTGAPVPPGYTDWSEVQAPNTIAGYGAQGPPISNTVADDFTVPGGGWIVNGFRVPVYQTGNTTTTPTITAINWAIGAAPTTTLTATPVGPADQAFTGLARVFTGATLTNRNIWEVTVKIPPITLGPGTYWLSWNMNGTLASGPWAPPVTMVGVPSPPGANGMQAIGAAGTFAGVTDAGGPQALAFKIQGIPEPATLGLLALGAFGLIRRRR